MIVRRTHKKIRRIPGGIVYDYVDKGDRKRFSIVLMKVRGAKHKTSNKLCDIAYVILRGRGSFEINNKKIDVKKGMVIYIEHNERYRASGNFDAIAINCPAFDKKYETVYN